MPRIARSSWQVEGGGTKKRGEVKEGRGREEKGGGKEGGRKKTEEEREESGNGQGSKERSSGEFYLLKLQHVATHIDP